MTKEGSGAAQSPTPADSLDPVDWAPLRVMAHQMLDDMLDHLAQRADQPVWQPMPPRVREAFAGALPEEPTSLAEVYQDFKQSVLPYAVGNTHPGFMGWVHGGGTAVGMLAEMLAAGLNANCGGRDHAPIEVERQISRWLAGLYGFPEGASGLFVTGTSMANLIALLIARHHALGPEVRRCGLAAQLPRVAYTSSAAHACVARAMDYAGLGSDALRVIATDAGHRMDIDALRAALADDRAAGRTPFLIVGSAGTVGIGAFDDLAALADIAATHRAWFHVDGAFGALGILSARIAPRLAGIERADSIALDFHKWAQVPYDAGFVLVRDGQRHRDTFATTADYLGRAPRGLAAGDTWPNDLGPDLSRGFRALKTWFTLRTLGTRRLGEMMDRSCRLAEALAARIAREAKLELMAPVTLNIVCFRYLAPGRASDADEVHDHINAEIVMDLQEAGDVAPSTVRIDGRTAIRAALFNHRTQRQHIEQLVDAVLSAGQRRSQAVATA